MNHHSTATPTGKREVTRAKILHAAWDLFRREGYQATSTRAIASQAGVAVGTVFSHFQTKQDLLRAGIMDKVDSLIINAQLSDNYTDPRDKLLHYASVLYDYYLQDRDNTRELFKVAIWQTEELDSQIESFQRLLFNAQAPFPANKAEIFMDCYFMTLFTGLKDPKLSSAQLLSKLERKLVLLD